MLKKKYFHEETGCLAWSFFTFQHFGNYPKLLQARLPMDTRISNHEIVWKQHCESLHTLLLCNCNIYIYIYAYENLTRKFIHRHFVLYLLKLYRIPCTGCFNSEQFLIALKKVKRCNIYDITLETAQNKKIVNYR